MSSMTIGRDCGRLGAPQRKQKIVVMEGPDGTGKSSIGYSLSKSLNVPYFRMGSQHANWRAGRFREALEFDQPYIAEFLRQTGYHAVIDRAWPSEWAYSRVFGRETNQGALRDVDEAFAQMGTYVVIALRRDYSVGRPDELVPPRMLPELDVAYREFAAWTRCSTVTIHVDDFGNRLESQVPAIESELHWGGTIGFISKVRLSRTAEKTPITFGPTGPETIREIDFGRMEPGQLVER